MNPKPLKIVIADDISDTLHMVCSLVKEVQPQAEIVGLCTSLAETKRMIETRHPDVVLLDIQFSAEGQTAFDLLESFRQNGGNNAFRTIIFSGHTEAEYYDMAFHYDAVHFLPKPIDKKRLKDALSRTSPHHAENNGNGNAQYLKGKLVINTATASHFISLDDIVLLQSKDTRTHIVLANEEVIKSSRNLGYYESQVSGNTNFVRIHHSAIVNLRYVHGLSSKTERNIILKPPFGEIKSSRERFKELLGRLKEE